MDPGGIEWVSRVSEFLAALIYGVGAILARLGEWLSALQGRYPQLFSPQTLFGLIGTTIAAWKWWEAREANLFRKFEEMIARNEAQLLKARNDLLDVMTRPGPGARIRPPLFVEKTLRRVLMRRRWHPVSLFPLSQKTDRQLERAIAISNRKVAAHLARLSLFRAEIASARLIQGALATARTASSKELHQRQLLEQEALDHFRAVLTLPGHHEDVVARELLAHQIARLDRNSQSISDAYQMLIDILEQREESPSRNLALARALRKVAILRYPNNPGIAQSHLARAITLMMQFGPPRDRDLLELGETIYLEGVARLRLNANVIGPDQLRLAQGHYRDLRRYLKSRRRGLFNWMFESRKFAGHRVSELAQRADLGLAQVNLLLRLNDKHQRLLITSLMRGSGVRRRNRKPQQQPKGH